MLILLEEVPFLLKLDRLYVIKIYDLVRLLWKMRWRLECGERALDWV